MNELIDLGRSVQTFTVMVELHAKCGGQEKGSQKD
jgi:hypothetical protein